MESILLFTGNLGAQYLFDSVILPKERLIMYSTFNNILLPKLGVCMMIFIITYLYAIFYTRSNCEKTQWRLESNAKVAAITGGLAAAIFAVMTYFPSLTSIFRKISILPRTTDFGVKMVVAISGIIWYKLFVAMYGRC
jgi:hypothetical protein